MGFWEWAQKKSSDKCRDNLTRGIPMFVEVCQRISACLENRVHPSDADVREGKRLFEMLWLNITNKSLPPHEIVAIIEPWLSNPERFSTYTHLQLQRLYEAFQTGAASPTMPTPTTSPTSAAGRGQGDTPVLESFVDDNRTGCWAIVRMDNGNPCWIAVAQTGILVKKSRTGLFGAKLYEEKNVYKAGRTAGMLDLTYPDDLTPNTMQNPVLKAITNAVLHCHSLAEVVRVLNEAYAPPD